LTLDVPLFKLGITVTEQRKHQRFDLRLPLEIVVGDAKNKAKGETRNVSSCGVLFTSKVPVEVGSSIEYLITLPKAPGTRAEVRLRCVGKVVRTDEQARFAATMERYEFVRQRI
jgi:hypothetical protein